MTCGIYKIQNKINSKVYIGQSINIEKRWNKHKSASQDVLDHSYETHLYRSFRKYGIENFDFSIIEECPIAELNQKERYWIQKYNSFFKGYNLTLGGDSSGTEIKKEKIIGIFKDLETTDLIQKEIALKWNISEEMVQGINTGRYWKCDNIEYPIRKPKITIQNYCIDCGKPIDRQAVRCVQCAQIYSRIVLRPNRKELKKLIRSTPFTQIARKYGVTDNAIRRWCDAENLPRKVSDIKKYSDIEWEKL